MYRRWYSGIQLLRGIAVFLVFLFHWNESIFPGGYLGVDIFFVISGFVVINAVIDSYASKSFNFKTFFLKRFDRIQPSALACIITCFFISIIFLIPYGVTTNFFTGIASAFGVANWYLLRISQEYFASTTVDSNLFLQFWSLSIEEQYYFFFALLISALQLASCRVGAMLTSLIFFSSISLVGFIFSNHNFAEPLLYFNTFWRFWEISLGACAYLLGDYFFKLKNKNVLSCIPLPLCQNSFNVSPTLTKCLGSTLLIAFLLLSFFAHMDKLTVLSCVLVIFLLLIGLRMNSLNFDNKNIKSTGDQLLHSHLGFIFRQLGDVSYSIYLWHWTIIYFISRYWSDYNNGLLGFIVCTFVIAAISFCAHYAFEKSFNFFGSRS